MAQLLLNVKFSLAGVINLTPDSFSDPALHQSPEQITKTLSHFKSHNVGILDIGAESTAPMNASIGPDHEWDRLQKHFFSHPKLAECLDFDLSLDSFRPQSARLFFSKLTELGFKNRMIWNDVSGVLDEEVFALVDEFKLTYIYCHNEVKSRSDVFAHSKLRGSGAIYGRVIADARRVQKEFEQRGQAEHLIFDPCFGFSKSVEENYELMKKSADMIKELSMSVMLGVSRKSFLRALVPGADLLSRSELNQYCDLLQSQYFSHLLGELREPDHFNHPLEIMLRLHAPESFSLSNKAQIFLK